MAPNELKSAEGEVNQSPELLAAKEVADLPKEVGDSSDLQNLPAQLDSPESAKTDSDELAQSLPKEVGSAEGDRDMRNCPVENGRWDGERGDSKWMPDPDCIPQKANPENKSWKDILEKSGIDGVKFKDGEPDFDSISKGTVKIEGFSASRDDNFDKADMALAQQRGCSPREVRQWRKEHKYTWHECKDMKTMQKVPSNIHNNISHRGGVSNIKTTQGDK